MVKERIDKKEIVSDDSEINDILIENFIGLQKAMTNLSIKFEALANQTSHLLEILEMSAKNIAKEGLSDNRELIKKIDILLEQNKILTGRMISSEEKMKIESQKTQPLIPQPITSTMQPAKIIKPTVSTQAQISSEPSRAANISNEYTPSISNKPRTISQ